MEIEIQKQTNPASVSPWSLHAIIIMKMLSLLVLILTCSCVANKPVEMHTTNFGSFSIDLPVDWKVNKIKGIDSYVKQIVTSDGDTIYFDYGYYSNSLEEKSIRIYPTSMISWFMENEVDTSGMVFLNKEKIEDSDREKHKKQKTTYELIDGYQAKIVEPRIIGNGLTGVYFDSLGVGDIGNIRLQISGQDLNSDNNELFLQSIRTIKIKNR